MAPFMRPLASQTYALLRIIAGSMFLCHGTQKLFGWPIGYPEGMEIPAFVTWIAGPVEFLGGLLVAVGLFTGWAAFISSGQMAAAYWMGHGTNGLFPIVNGGELAALYCFVFLMISAHGAGTWSLDESRGAP